MNRVPARFTGLALAALALLPLHHLLDAARTGAAGRATREAAEAAWRSGLWGTGAAVLMAAALAWLLRAHAPRLLPAATLRAPAPPPPGAWTAAAAALALVGAAATAAWVHRGTPTSVDAMVQLAHARALLAGGLTLPPEFADAAWAVQNGVFTPRGWASIYPPGHTAALALGLAVGAPWLVGPAMVASGTLATALTLRRLMPHGWAAPVAAFLLAVTPFWLLLGSTHLSHATAAAAGAWTLYLALRVRDGAGHRWAWALGGALGAFVLTRPWTGLTVGAALASPAFVGEGGLRPGWRRSLAALVGGGLPWALMLFGWNRALFGHPLRTGYTAAFGPAHGLGFHTDPWGNAYGPLEALAYTGADLTLLGAHLLQSPLSPVLLVAAALVLGATTPPARPWLAAALTALGANVLYWHHGIHMGPRMLFEVVPAWVVLTVCAVAGLWRLARRRGAAWQLGVVVLVGLGLGGAVLTAPGAFAAHRAPVPPRLPEPPVRPALLFVHGSWASRVAARLAAAGMRRDSIETALRRNDLCAVDTYARARPGAARPSLDFRPLPGRPAHLTPVQLSPGNVAFVRPELQPTPACRREARSDRFGTLELEPLLWRAPPRADEDVIVARDMGPEHNARVLERLPGRTPYLLVPGGDGSSLMLLNYADGMVRLWGSAEGG